MFQDDESHLPRDLMVVNQMSLVVRTHISVAAIQKTQQNTTNKNFKKFKKVCAQSLKSQRRSKVAKLNEKLQEARAN